MEVSSVGSSSAAFQQQVTSRKQPEESDLQATQPKEVESPQRTRQAESRTRPERSEQPEQPKPVVNAQGQKTGTIINTTA